jgi:hypothetical protein
MRIVGPRAAFGARGIDLGLYFFFGDRRRAGFFQGRCYGQKTVHSRALAIFGGQELDEILDLGDALGRQGLNFLKQGLDVWHGMILR